MPEGLSIALVGPNYFLCDGGRGGNLGYALKIIESLSSSSLQLAHTDHGRRNAPEKWFQDALDQGDNIELFYVAIGENGNFYIRYRDHQGQYYICKDTANSRGSHAVLRVLSCSMESADSKFAQPLHYTNTKLLKIRSISRPSRAYVLPLYLSEQDPIILLTGATIRTRGIWMMLTRLTLGLKMGLGINTTLSSESGWAKTRVTFRKGRTENGPGI